MSFTPHPLLGLNFMERAAGMTIPNAVKQVEGAERRRSERLLLDVGDAKRRAYFARGSGRI